MSDPALDLALALAIAASHRDRALAADTLACGEVSLLGEVRPVRGLDRRLREAARLGFRRAIIPAVRHETAAGAPDGLTLVPVATVREAIEEGIGPGTGTSG